MSLREVRVEVTPPYVVHVGPGAIDLAAAAAAPFSAWAVLTDTCVEALYGERLGELAGAPRLALEPGEAAKDLGGLGSVLDFLSGAGLDRGSVLVTFGGGVISDLGGLAASLFLRGIAVIHVPTTLLAQVDAAVGGKTAINLHAGKNLAGTFHQPRAVLADTRVLATLAADDFRSGLGEVVKSALLSGEAEFARLERDAGRLVARDAEALSATVAACVALKARVVAGDEREQGARRALNLGHTFAHAIERVAGYGHVPHGIAVAAGLACALELSRSVGRLRDDRLPGRLARLLEALDLPRGLDDLRRSYGAALPTADLLRAMRSDKKGRAGRPTFVLVAGLGRPVPDVEVDEATLAALLA